MFESFISGDALVVNSTMYVVSLGPVSEVDMVRTYNTVQLIYNNVNSMCNVYNSMCILTTI